MRWVTDRQSELLDSYLLMLNEKGIYDSSCLAKQNQRKSHLDLVDADRLTNGSAPS